jgi:excisionase family DNA binding protein
MLTVEQVAARLSVGTRTVQRLIHTGQLEAYKVGGAFRITEDALTDYLESVKTVSR